MGLVGSTLRSGNYQVLWGAAFLGWNVKWIRGYRTTAELRQALERGEIDMTTFGASTDIQYLLRTGKFAVVSQSGTVKGGKQVPRSILGSAPIIFPIWSRTTSRIRWLKRPLLTGSTSARWGCGLLCLPGRPTGLSPLMSTPSRPRSMIPNIGLNSQRSTQTRP